MDMHQDCDLGPVLSGGYMLVWLTERAAWMSHDLLPERILSASDCVACPHLPALWAFISSSDPDALRRSSASAVAIADDRLVELVLSLSEQGEASGVVSWPDVFLTIDGARRFAARFLPIADEWTLIGLGLQQRYVAAVEHRLGAGRTGCWAAIDHARELAPGGELLGFELLGFDGAGSGHTWLCNGVERTFYEAGGVRPNHAGFLATPQDAAGCLAHIIAHPDYAEPVPWFPWLVVRYSR